MHAELCEEQHCNMCMCNFAVLMQKLKGFPGFSDVHLCSNAAGVTALSSKAVTAGLTEQHWCSWHEQVSQASVMCIFAQMQQSCVKCKNSKV